jgi:probable HAF family extracellular repeat protein
MLCRRFVLIASFLFSALSFAQSNVKTIQPTFTTVDVPGATINSVNGINTAGDMVGWYADSSSGPYHAFLVKGGNMSFFDHPGSVSTLATGINDSGLIIGYTGDFYDTGFTYDGNTFAKVQPAKQSRTFLYGINNAGEIVGGAGTPYTTIGIDLKNGKFKTIKFPGSYVYAYATGINNLGEIVGYTDVETHAFTYLNGKFQRIDFPGSSESEAWGVNDTGVVVGWYATSGGCVCAYAVHNGNFVSFSYPGAQATIAISINSFGNIVGEYTFDFVTYHGFVTNPISTIDFK